MGPSTEPDPPCRRLATASLAQLACGVVGMGVAVRRRHAYDVGFVRGTPQAVGRDSVLMGTALSAPVTMLTTQSVLTALVVTRGERGAARGLGLLGGLMVAGYLAERHVRHLLRPGGWDPLETTLVVSGMLLAALMTRLSTRCS